MAIKLQKNVAEVALEAGNSPQMIFQHYRELVRPDAAKEWFGIVPTGNRNTPIPLTAPFTKT